MKRFAFIHQHRTLFSIELMSRVMGVTSRGYRAWRQRGVSDHQRQDQIILVHIRDQYTQSLATYGRPRLTQQLKAQGLSVGHRRVGRLMKENGICAVRTRAYKVTTNAHHNYPVAPNLLNRDFQAQGPNQKWVGDISYLWTQEGWLYLAVILDLYSRRVIGWAVGDRLTKDLAIRALNMAISLRQPLRGCLHHTDRGSQYCSHAYQAILKEHGFLVSMSAKGACYDNAVVETFFKTIKAELVWRQSWPTRRHAHAAIFQYINGFYNPRRRHSSLGYQSPLAFEAWAA